MTPAPYWLDYMARERTCCTLCNIEGKGWVKIGPPLVAGTKARLAAFRNQQRSAMLRHMAEVHPTVRVRASR